MHLILSNSVFLKCLSLTLKNFHLTQLNEPNSFLPLRVCGGRGRGIVGMKQWEQEHLRADGFQKWSLYLGKEKKSHINNPWYYLAF